MWFVDHPEGPLKFASDMRLAENALTGPVLPVFMDGHSGVARLLAC